MIYSRTNDKFIYFDVRNGIFCKLYRTTMLPTEQDPKILLTTFELETTRVIVTSQSIDHFHQIKAII